MSARDVLAASLWLIDREIAGAPLPHPSWATFRENDPETAAIYETQAGCHLSALSAAGYAVVPREPTEAMIKAGAAAQWRKMRDVASPTPTEHPDDGGGSLGYAYSAMIAASQESTR